MRIHALTRGSFAAVQCAFAVLALPVFAGEKPATSKPDLGEYELVIANDRLAWAGGSTEATLGGAVDALREMHPNANIVMSPGLSKVKLADLKLRGSRLPEELEALRVASGGKFDWVGPGSPMPNIASPSAIDPATGLPAAGADPNVGLFVLREPMPTPETHRMVEAFNLEPYLEWLRTKQDSKESSEGREQQIQKSLGEIEEIVMETIAKLKRGEGSAADAPSFQFHRGANLLIVIGPAEAVDVARRIVMALPRPQSPAAGSEQMVLRSKLTEQLLTTQQELAQLRTQFTEDHPRVKELLARFETLKQQLSQLGGEPGLRR